MVPSRRRPLPLALAFAFVMMAVASSCKPAPSLRSIHDPKGKKTLYVALIGAMTGESGYSVEQAFQAARLAFQVSNDTGRLQVYLEPVMVDSTADNAGATDAVAPIVSNPSVIAAILWTSTGDTPSVTASLEKAGVGFVDVSPTNPGVTWPGSLRMVAGDDRQVAADTSWITSRYPGRVCLVGDAAPRDVALLGMASGDLSGASVAWTRLSTEPEQTHFSATVAAAERAGCASVFWAGRPIQAGLFRTALAEAGLASLAMVGTDEIVNDRYVATAAQGGSGTVATCPCVFANYDQGKALETFIQTYQARYGVAPGSFAIEGWDSAQLLISTMSGGATTRPALRSSIGSVTDFRGLARTYVFLPGGALSSQGAVVWLQKDEYAAWLPLGRAVLGGSIPKIS